jgi:hypothetical protein
MVCLQMAALYPVLATISEKWITLYRVRARTRSDTTAVVWVAFKADFNLALEISISCPGGIVCQFISPITHTKLYRC